MKKLRMFLATAALLIAGGATLATNLLPVMDGYEHIPGSTPICRKFSTNCTPDGENLCTINGNKVGDVNNISTACGTQLFEP